MQHGCGELPRINIASISNLEGNEVITFYMFCVDKRFRIVSIQ
jgi:hypothetical protein